MLIVLGVVVYTVCLFTMLGIQAAKWSNPWLTCTALDYFTSVLWIVLAPITLPIMIGYKVFGR